MNDDNPARGIAIGVAIGAVFWIAFGVVIVMATYQKPQLSAHVYVCEPRAACQVQR